MNHILLALFLAPGIITDVRKSASEGNLADADRLVTQHQREQGVTPESLEAYSWLARGALANKKYDEAERYAAETKKRVLALVKPANLDKERHLPIALGAAIEVQAHVLDAKEGRSAAVDYLKQELKTWKTTSIVTRIQKNLNVLSLEGKPAPKLEGMARIPGPALLFFWAHWCPDCKATAPVIAQLQKEFPKLAVAGPTQLYGYAAAGREVGPAEEKAYIEATRAKFYGEVRDMAVPVSQDNFRSWGASTTPTLVLVDAAGIVRLYHPGRMTVEELRPHVQKLF
ncbi:MAG: redoxin domain-containing protein [Bryobacteraceae bacterium]|nr:redoxin domain-containing protein [Bryobacteraceae bacterium]